MNELQIFQSPEFGQVRTLTIQGEPWFVGKDVAERLGYSNTKDALSRHVDDEDKGGSRFPTPSGVQEMTVINESGLYSLVLGSKLPTAKAFKRWITGEVIPTIRKTGGYVNNDSAFVETYLPFADEATKSLFRSTLETIRQQNAKIEADRPKVLFADAVSTAKSSILIGELAKLLKQNGVDMGQNRLFDYLRKHGYLISRKGSDYNMPTQRSMERGWFEIKETAITHADGSISVSKTVKVTGKGQQYFINLFLNRKNA